MTEKYVELHNKLLSVASDLDNEKDIDKNKMFQLLSSYDYQLEQAVKTIEKLETLVITKEMENYGIR